MPDLPRGSHGHLHSKRVAHEATIASSPGYDDQLPLPPVILCSSGCLSAGLSAAIVRGVIAYARTVPEMPLSWSSRGSATGVTTSWFHTFCEIRVWPGGHACSSRAAR